MERQRRLLRTLRSRGWHVTSYRAGRQRIYQVVIQDGNAGILFHLEFGEQGPEDLSISYLMVMPAYQRGKGFGSHYLDAFLAAARECGFTRIRAIEVLPGTEAFWSRHGFVHDSEADPKIDYLYRPADG